jgi:hypothetical protein
MYGNLPRELVSTAYLEPVDDQSELDRVELAEESVFCAILNCVRFCRNPGGQIDAACQRPCCKALAYLGEHFDLRRFTNQSGRGYPALFPWGSGNRWATKTIAPILIEALRRRGWSVDPLTYFWSDAIELLKRIVPHIAQD